MPARLTASCQSLQSLLVDRLVALPEVERRALRRAVEAAQRRCALRHRVREGEPPVPHPMALCPVVLPAGLVPALRRVARAVHGFQARTPEFYAADVLGFRSLCPLEPAAEAWLSYDLRRSDGRDLLIRLDVGLAADGRIGVFETNSTALAGLFNHSAGVRILGDVVLPRLLSPSERRRLRPPPDLLELVFDWVCGRARPRGVAFIEAAGGGAGWSELPQIARYIAARGVPCGRGVPSSLRLTGDGVRLRRQPVDVMYRDLQFAHLPDPAQCGSKLAGFIDLVRRGHAIPGVSAEFYHKGVLEPMTSAAWGRYFSGGAARLLRQSVPWTRVLWARRTDGPAGARIDLPRYAAACQEHLVIKPNRGSGGEGVVLGREAPARAWDRAIERALREPGRWVVQERFDAPPRPMVYLQESAIHRAPCFLSLGLFYVRGRLGLHGRISPHPVVNVGRGGALACVFLAAGGR